MEKKYKQIIKDLKQLPACSPYVEATLVFIFDLLRQSSFICLLKDDLSLKEEIKFTVVLQAKACHNLERPIYLNLQLFHHIGKLCKWLC